MRWTDNHCHLPADLDEARAVVDEARSVGVARLVDVGTDVDSSKAAAERAAALDGVWATAGVHPHDAATGLDGLDEVLRSPGVVAVGACGLDYHYDHSPRAAQRDVFARPDGHGTRPRSAPRDPHPRGMGRHVRHPRRGRRAVRDGVPLLHGRARGGQAPALGRGAHLSISGIVTFKTADDVRAAVRLAAPRPAAGRDRLALPGSRCRTGAGPTSRLLVDVVGQGVALRRVSNRPRQWRRRPGPTPSTSMAFRSLSRPLAGADQTAG